MYLTAILRDYLRAFARNTYAIGNALFEKDGEENNCFYIRISTIFFKVAKNLPLWFVCL